MNEKEVNQFHISRKTELFTMKLTIIFDCKKKNI